TDATNGVDPGSFNNPSIPWHTISNASAFAASTGGCTIHIPAGWYNEGINLFLPSHTHWIGDGKRATFISMATNGANPAVFIGEDCSIQGITIYGEIIPTAWTNYFAEDHFESLIDVFFPVQNANYLTLFHVTSRSGFDCWNGTSITNPLAK